MQVSLWMMTMSDNGLTRSLLDQLNERVKKEPASSSEDDSLLRGNMKKRRGSNLADPPDVVKAKQAKEEQPSKSGEQQQQQQQRSSLRSVPSYVSMYNDRSIIQQRQNRPKLKLSDFHIRRTLGTGSFGRVHLVQSCVNARYYAIKVLKKSEVVRLKQGQRQQWIHTTILSTSHSIYSGPLEQ